MAYDCIARFSQSKDINVCKLTQPMEVSQRQIFEKMKLKRQSQRPAVAHQSGCEAKNVLDIYIHFVARINLEPTLTETIKNQTRKRPFSAIESVNESDMNRGQWTYIALSHKLIVRRQYQSDRIAADLGSAHTAIYVPGLQSMIVTTTRIEAGAIAFAHK